MRIVINCNNKAELIGYNNLIGKKIDLTTEDIKGECIVEGVEGNEITVNILDKNISKIINKRFVTLPSSVGFKIKDEK